MQKYTVKFEVTGSESIDVQAKSKEEAVALAALQMHDCSWAKFSYEAAPVNDDNEEDA